MKSIFKLVKTLPNNIESDDILIKAEEYLVQHQADSLLRAANEKANNILENAKNNASIKLKKGYQKGISLAKKENAERFIKAEIKIQKMIQAAEIDLINLVKFSIKKLIGDMDDTRKIVQLVQSGLMSIRDDHKIRIRVAPEMENTIKIALPNIINQLPALEYFEVIADEKLPRDSYLLEGDTSTVKGSISLQIDKLNELVEAALE